MSARYKKGQVGNAVIIILGSSIIICANIMYMYGFHPVAFIILLAALIGLPLGGTLTVEVDDREVRARLGIGLIRKTIPIDDIESCDVRRIPWYWGWGFRLSPRGWMFRVSGLSVVELFLKDGRRFCIGSNEPDILARAINAAVDASRGKQQGLKQ